MKPSRSRIVKVLTLDLGQDSVQGAWWAFSVLDEAMQVVTSMANCDLFTIGKVDGREGGKCDIECCKGVYWHFATCHISLDA